MAKGLPCSNHPELSAAFACRGCQLHACERCANHAWVGDHFEDRCPRCGQTMQALGGGPLAAAAIPERGAAALLARLPRLARFLGRPALLLMLLGLALLTAPIYWAVQYNIHMILGLLGLLIILGLEASIYFRIVVQTAYGEEEVSPPGLGDLHSDLMAPAVRYLAALAPVLLGIVWYAEQAFGSVWFGVLAFQRDPLAILEYPGPTLLTVGGVILLPLLTVIAAMSTSAFHVLNPVTWLSSLRVLRGTYLVGAAAFYTILAFEVLVWDEVQSWIAVHLDIPVLTRVAILFLGYLPFAFRARLLGALVEPYLNDSDQL